MAVVLGPVLKFCGAEDGHWIVSALVVYTDDIPATGAASGGLAVPMERHSLGERALKGVTYKIDTFRMRVPQAAADGHCSYRIGEHTHDFTVPAAGHPPTCAYASCNGFSDPKKIKDYGHKKNAMWSRMDQNHARRPYHLLLMGGDQLYSDAMWHGKLLKTWAASPSSSKVTQKPMTAALQREIDDFFFQAYLSAWAQPELARMLATVPTVMMWDDHDIIDGWGSYPKEFQSCGVFQGIYDIARRHFLLFQQHAADASAMPQKLPDQPGHSYALRVGDCGILALDLRSERSTEQVMSPAAWNAVYAWLEQQRELRHLLVMSSIPVVHPDFSTLEMLLCALPGRQELEDDLKDHWLSRSHQWERLRLIHRLQEWSAAHGSRVTILSGDVHVGAIGAIETTRQHHEGQPVTIHQLTSSGIVHPPPPAMALFYLEHVGDKVEQLEGGTTTAMYKFPGTSHRYLGARNYLSIEPDRAQDGRPLGRLWANWWIEHEDQPYRQAILPLRKDGPQ